MEIIFSINQVGVVNHMKLKKLYICLVCFLTMILTTTVTCYANPDSYPFIVVIVENAPPDLVITFSEVSKGHHTLGYKYTLGKETQFSFYSDGLTRTDDCKISVATNGSSTEYSIAAPLVYRNVYTLDLQNNSLTNGKRHYAILD